MLFQRVVISSCFVVIAIGFLGSSVFGQAISLDDISFESFVVENGQMAHICRTFRLLGAPVSLHHLRLHSDFDGLRMRPNQVYVDSAGRNAFFASDEPLLSFSLQSCSGTEVLNEACRVSGKFRWSMKNGHSAVLPIDSELEAIHCTTSRFRGQFLDYFSLNRKEFVYLPENLKYRDRSKIVDVPEINRQPFREAFDVLAESLSTTHYWDFRPEGSVSFDAAEPWPFDVRNVSLKFPTLQLADFDAAQTEVFIPYSVVLQSADTPKRKIVVELLEGRSNEEDRLASLKTFANDCDSLLLDAFERGEVSFNDNVGVLLSVDVIAGIWERVPQLPTGVSFPAENLMTIVSRPEVAKRLPLDVLDEISTSGLIGSVYAAGFIDDGFVRGPFVISKRDEQNSTIIAWEEFDRKRRVSDRKRIIRKLSVSLTNGEIETSEKLVVVSYGQKFEFVRSKVVSK